MTRKLFILMLLLAMVFTVGCLDSGDGDDTDGDTTDGDSTTDGDLPDDCTADQFACQGNDIYKCNASSGWDFYLSCADQGYVCQNGLCQDPGTTDGDTPDGDTPDGDTPDGDTPDGDTPDGDTPDGDTPDGDTPDGDNPDGDTPDGDTPDGDLPDPGQAGGACTFGPVNPNAGDCDSGLECIGAYADGSNGDAVTCSTNSDCEDTFGPQAVCASGYCGISWCTHSCTEGTVGDCEDLDQGSDVACCGPVGDSSMCYVPSFCEQSVEPGDGTGGDPCTFGAVNPNAGNCANGFICIGAHANASSQQPVTCSSDADCTSSFGSVGVCAGGYCGVSWCTAECTDNTDCDPSHGSGACCDSIGSGENVCFVPDFCSGTVEPGDRGAGETCTFGVLYPSVGNCQEGFSCIGMHANASSQSPASCANDGDCATAFGDDSATCVDGYCGIAWCAGDCTSDADCSDSGYSSPACCGAVGSDQMCYRASFCQEG